MPPQGLHRLFCHASDPHLSFHLEDSGYLAVVPSHSNSPGTRRLRLDPPVDIASKDDTPVTLRVNEAGERLAIWYGRTCYVWELPAVHQMTAQDTQVLELKNPKKLLLTAEILQLEWHPLSGHHLCVMTANRISLYNMARRQNFWEAWFETNAAVAFVFGGRLNWAQFTIFLANGIGEIGILCPVIPEGAVITSEQLKKLREAPEMRSVSGLSRKNFETVVNCSFREVEESNGTLFVYDPASSKRKEPSKGTLLGSVKYQKVSFANNSKISCASPSSQAPKLLSMIAFPMYYRFIHFIRIYDSGTVDLCVILSPVVPSWGVNSSSSVSTPAMKSCISLYRFHLRDWVVPLNASPVVSSFFDPTLLEGAFICVDDRIYGFEVRGLDLISLSLQGTDSHREALGEILRSTWKSQLCSEEASFGFTVHNANFDPSLLTASASPIFIRSFAFTHTLRIIEDVLELPKKESLIVGDALPAPFTSEESDLLAEVAAIREEIKNCDEVKDAEKLKILAKDLFTVLKKVHDLESSFSLSKSPSSKQKLSEIFSSVRRFQSRVETLEKVIDRAYTYSRSEISALCDLQQFKNSVSEFTSVCQHLDESVSSLASSSLPSPSTNLSVSDLTSSEIAISTSDAKSAALQLESLSRRLTALEAALLTS